MVSPSLLASSNACRSEPAPLSLVLMTTELLKSRRSSNCSSKGRNNWFHRPSGVPARSLKGVLDPLGSRKSHDAGFRGWVAARHGVGRGRCCIRAVETTGPRPQATQLHEARSTFGEAGVFRESLTGDAGGGNGFLEVAGGRG